MEAVWMKIVEMSIAASWLIVAVILLRLFLSKAPKGFRYVLWALVAIRLICPFSIESNLSLVPDTDGFLTETVPGVTLGDNVEAGDNDDLGDYVGEGEIVGTGGTISSGENNIVTKPGQGTTVQGITPSVPDTTPSVPDTNAGISDITPVVPQTDEVQWTKGLSWVWAAGTILLIVYMVLSYTRLWNRVKISVPIDEKVYICDDIQSPFIFGVVRPSVYIPSRIEKEQLTYVLAHEREHLRCMDHMWKPLGFLLLSIHWFNPLVWVAYILMCRDLELACDERVIRQMNSSEKRNYSETLLACSAPGHYISVCPVAFGEIGIKERIKRVLSYKKPTIWVIATAAALCVVVSVCFMTDPARTEGMDELETETGSEIETDSEVESGSEIETDSEMDSETETEPEFGTEPLSTEKVLYETKADLNHDGNDDLVRTMISSENEEFDLESGADAAYIQIYAGTDDGSYEPTPCYTSDYYGTSHSANGAYCLTQKEGKDYLLYSNMYEHMGSAYYEYSVFYLSSDSEVQMIEVEKDSASFSTSPFWPQWLDTPHREDEVPQFQQKMTVWVENAKALFILDVFTPVYCSTMEAEVAAKEYYDSVWARSDEDEIQEFYDIVGSEPWKMYFYNLDMMEDIEYLNELAASDWSEWYKDYNGETLQRIADDGVGGLTTNHDIIYYAAKDGEDVQSVLKTMIEAMIVPRMENDAKRNYTITKYRVEEQPILQITDHIWLVEYLNGYYAYEGFEGTATMEERLEYDEVDSDGMVQFDISGGDTSEFFYLLIEENGVYRLEYYSSMK